MCGRGPVELGCSDGGGNAEFGGDRGDRGRADGEVGLAVSGEIRCDERLVVDSGFVRGVSTEKSLDVPHRDIGFVVNHLQGAPVGAYDGLDRGVVRVNVGGIDGHAYGGDLEMVADPGQHLPAMLGGYRFRCHGAANQGGVDLAFVQPAQVHTVVTGRADDGVNVAVRVESGPAQHNPGEAPRCGVGGVYRQPSSGQVSQGGQAWAGEEPEQRVLGVDIERDPGDAIGQSGQERSTEPDGGAVAQPLLVPGAAVAQRNVDALVGVVALLVGDVGNQFLVQAPPDVGEIDRVHERFSFFLDQVSSMRRGMLLR